MIYFYSNRLYEKSICILSKLQEKKVGFDQQIIKNRKINKCTLQPLSLTLATWGWHCLLNYFFFFIYSFSSIPLNSLAFLINLSNFYFPICGIFVSVSVCVYVSLCLWVVWIRIFASCIMGVGITSVYKRILGIRSLKRSNERPLPISLPTARPSLLCRPQSSNAVLKNLCSAAQIACTLSLQSSLVVYIYIYSFSSLVLFSSWRFKLTTLCTSSRGSSGTQRGSCRLCWSPPSWKVFLSLWGDMRSTL